MTSNQRRHLYAAFDQLADSLPSDVVEMVTSDFGIMTGRIPERCRADAEELHALARAIANDNG